MAKMGRPKTDNPRSKNVSLRLTPEQHEDLLSYSKRHGQTVTQTIVQGLYLLLERENKEIEEE